MTKKEIIDNLYNQSYSTTMSAAEKKDFREIADAVEAAVDMKAHGAKEVLRLEKFEKLLWIAAKNYKCS